MMTGYEFSQGQFQDVEWLINEVNALYETKIVPAGLPDKLALTQLKVVEERNWNPSMPLISKNFAQVLSEMNAFYVPKAMNPGPAFVFPERDANYKYRRARVKTMWNLIMKGSPVRYAGIGHQYEFLGPEWIGNTQLMVKRILDSRSVLIVEGPFDMLAVRLLLPELPVLSAGTNYLGWKHLDYLRILGVKDILLMFDQDALGSNGKSAGIDAMASLRRKLERRSDSMRAVPLTCPAKDPSKALESYRGAAELKSKISSAFEFYANRKAPALSAN